MALDEATFTGSCLFITGAHQVLTFKHTFKQLNETKGDDYIKNIFKEVAKANLSTFYILKYSGFFCFLFSGLGLALNIKINIKSCKPSCCIQEAAADVCGVYSSFYGSLRQNIFHLLI